MKVYVGHSKSFDFKNELYNPLRKVKDCVFVFPHELNDASFNSKSVLRDCDVMIAEVSYPSVSLGVEIGWADSMGVTVVLLYKVGVKFPLSLKNVSKYIIEYSSSDDLVKKVSAVLGKL